MIDQFRNMGRLPYEDGVFSMRPSLEYQSGRDHDYTPQSRYTRRRRSLQDSRNPRCLLNPRALRPINITYTLREAKRNVEQPTGEVTSRQQTVGTRGQGENIKLPSPCG